MRVLLRRAILFLCGATLVLAILPAINIVRRGNLEAPASTLFDTEFAWPAVSAALTRVGISTRPQLVLVGKSGWLFLGDRYAQSITDKRRPANDNDAAAAARRATATQAWAGWLEARGITDWHVLVCADKDSVYPEFLPAWDRPASGAAIDVALRSADPRIVVDSRPALRQAHATAGPALYLRTDSHWTARGAWIAYRALAQASLATVQGVDWLQDRDVRIVETRARSGDLARLLYVPEAEGDDAAAAEIAQARDAQRTRVDAITAMPLDDILPSHVEAPRQPALIRSPHALNARRLLWLRDSFGAALLPYIAATFSEVIEVDRETTTPARMADMVQRFKPDSVLVSVVERNARATWFEVPPP